MADISATTLAELTGQFPPASTQDWSAVAQKALRGVSPDSLSGKTRDGILCPPVHLPSAFAPLPESRRTGSPWAIVQRIDDPDIDRSAGQAKTDVAGGADMLGLCFAGGPAAGGFGIAGDGPVLATLMELAAQTRTGLRLEPHPGSLETARIVARAAEEAQKSHIRFGVDPLGILAARGQGASGDADPGAQLAPFVASMREQGFAGPLLEADGRAYHDAGATDGQELGIVLATAIAYVRALTLAGTPTGLAAGAIGFTLAAGCDQFETMAKFRALRLLWARAGDLLEVDRQPVAIHAETSRRMVSRADAHNNLVRATVAAFAAGCGGADSIAILPHTSAHGLADGDARRMACNIHHLLIEESHSARVADPGQGSGLVAALTEGLAETGWTTMQAIEREGGLHKSLTAGTLQARIAETGEAYMQNIVAGNGTVVGVTDFVPSDPQSYPVVAPAGSGEDRAAPGGATAPLPRLYADLAAGSGGPS